MKPEDSLILRPLNPGDEAEFTAAQQAMNKDGWTFGPARRGLPWGAYLRLIESWSEGRNLPAGHVRSTFLVAEAGGVIVGGVTIRWALTPELERKGGHAGYGILPEFRRRGYATSALDGVAALLHEAGIDPVLVTCADDNIGSAKVIEACGGRLQDVLGGQRRYWIL